MVLGQVFLPVLGFFFISIRIKNEHVKEIMGVKEKPDIIDTIERKRLQWYGHVKRMQEERLPKLTLGRLMSYIYIYGAPILDVSRSHTTTQHSR